MIKVPSKAVKNVDQEMIPVYQMEYVAKAMRSWLKGDFSDTMFADHIDAHFGMRSVKRFTERSNSDDAYCRHNPHDFFGMLVFNAKPQPAMRCFTKREMYAPTNWRQLNRQDGRY